MSSSETKIELVAQASAATAKLPVVITNDQGVKLERLVGFQYAAQAKIVAVSPALGQLGTRTTIVGSGLLMGAGNFGASSSITLSGIEVAKIVSSSDKAIVVDLAVNKADCAKEKAKCVGRIQLTQASCALVHSGGVNFEYVTQGAIAKLSPAFGHGGT